MHNIIVLGCGRSGTSMVMGSLSAAGYHIGDNPWHPINLMQKAILKTPNYYRLTKKY